MGFKFISVRHLRKTCIKRTAAQVPLTIMVITYYGHICIVKNLCTKRTLQKGRMFFCPLCDHLRLSRKTMERAGNVSSLWSSVDCDCKAQFWKGGLCHGCCKVLYSCCTVGAWCWLRGCWSCPRSLSLPLVVPLLFSPHPCTHYVAPVAAVSCGCFPGVRFDFGGLHVPPTKHPTTYMYLQMIVWTFTQFDQYRYCHCKLNSLYIL